MVRVGKLCERKTAMRANLLPFDRHHVVIECSAYKQAVTQTQSTVDTMVLRTWPAAEPSHCLIYRRHPTHRTTAR
jgi:hypothetical protein